MPYDWTAFFRPPAYPLFIALVHSLSIPLRNAIELLQSGAYLVLVAAFRKARVSRLVCLLIFAALLFHPGSFQQDNYALADNFYAAILTFVIGALGLTLVTRQIFPAVCAGFAFAVLWNTREEYELLFVIFAAFLTIWLASDFFQTHSWMETRRRLLIPAFLIFLAAALPIIAVDAANYHAFGSFAKSSMSASSFARAYRALLRIKPSQHQRFIPVSREARQLAYAVSPTFARLRNDFEGKPGHDWELETFGAHGIKGEIGTGWSRWALRSIAGICRCPSNAADGGTVL